jgi:hypothetical protein
LTAQTPAERRAAVREAVAACVTAAGRRADRARSLAAAPDAAEARRLLAFVEHEIDQERRAEAALDALLAPAVRTFARDAGGAGGATDAPPDAAVDPGRRQVANPEDAPAKPRKPRRRYEAPAPEPEPAPAEGGQLFPTQAPTAQEGNL